MPITKGFKVPDTAAHLTLPANPATPLYLAFIASADPATGQPWCPDVRAALPYLDAAFAGDTRPHLTIIEVGQKPQWKDPKNPFRTKWNIHNVPALVRYQRVDGAAPAETGRLMEGEILDEKRLYEFIGQTTRLDDLEIGRVE
ncbi:Uu.00g099920.m01.CDS01 [Anthostomella pinea]|uniref:Uu.00g099920.m01.CDS01 n=1 Tax=Anthostomella pinea TaxID=933095 RepID=A0AAI8V7T8_9PEZI|nr:Uu.00g099920.m01.CDS01 [Anthostomella pinea]